MPLPWPLRCRTLSPPSAAAMRPFTPLLDIIGRSRKSSPLLPSANGGIGDGAALAGASAPLRGPPTLPGVRPSSVNGYSSYVPQFPGEDGMCICQRPHAVVLCHVCGWYSRCRLMKPCRDHSNTRFLLDLTSCPRCRAFSHLMSEYECPADVSIRPCTLPMLSKDIGPVGRRSPSPMETVTGGTGGTGAAYGAAGGAAAWAGSTGRSSSATAPRARMRPPLQSDGQGMQRKARDRFCSHHLARTPSGLPVSVYYNDGTSAPQDLSASGGGDNDADGSWPPRNCPMRGRRRQ